MTQLGENYIKAGLKILHNIENNLKTIYFKFFTKLRKREGKPSKLLVDVIGATVVWIPHRQDQVKISCLFAELKRCYWMARMRTWRCRARDTIQFGGIGGSPCAKMFSSNMHLQKILLHLLIGYWNVEADCFMMDIQSLTIEEDDIYFISGLFYRGEVVNL